MKKQFLLIMMCLMALLMIALSAFTKEGGDVTEKYVDLSLSSGTMWKTVN